MTDFDVEYCRRQFPQFRNPDVAAWAFCENAGGSYAPGPVVERMNRYLCVSRSQPYYPHDMSTELGEGMDDSIARIAESINAQPDEIVLGASSTINVFVLANALRAELRPGDRIILSTQDHETNIGAWSRLADMGVEVGWWEPDPESGLLDPADLESLLTNRTRLVCFTHCSNIVGSINPASDVIDMAHAAGARVCLDGVSYAPHCAVDTGALDVDFYLLSLYKTYGSFQGLMYVRCDHVESVANQGHFFNEAVLRKRLDPAGPSHGEIYAAGGMIDYLESVYRHHGGDTNRPLREQVQGAYRLFAMQEQKLLAPLLEYLVNKPGVRVIGTHNPDRAIRVPTISFTAESIAPEMLVNRLTEYKVAAGFGHFYAYRLIQRLGIDPDSGVTRLSLVHYNTEQEVGRVIEALDGIL